MPEWSKGVDSSSTVFALVGSNPTADTRRHHTFNFTCYSATDKWQHVQHWPAPGEPASTTNMEISLATSASSGRMLKTDCQCFRQVQLTRMLDPRIST